MSTRRDPNLNLPNSVEDVVLEAFDALPKSQPSAALDAKILAAARSAVEPSETIQSIESVAVASSSSDKVIQTNRFAHGIRMRRIASFATAAVVVIAVAIVMPLRDRSLTESMNLPVAVQSMASGPASEMDQSAAPRSAEISQSVASEQSVAGTSNSMAAGAASSDQVDIQFIEPPPPPPESPKVIVAERRPEGELGRFSGEMAASETSPAEARAKLQQKSDTRKNELANSTASISALADDARVAEEMVLDEPLENAEIAPPPAPPAPAAPVAAPTVAYSSSRPQALPASEPASASALARLDAPAPMRERDAAGASSNFMREEKTAAAKKESSENLETIEVTGSRVAGRTHEVEVAKSKQTRQPLFARRKATVSEAAPAPAPMAAAAPVVASEPMPESTVATQAVVASETAGSSHVATEAKSTDLGASQLLRDEDSNARNLLDIQTREKQIRDLLKAKKVIEARKQFNALRKAHPDWLVPDDLKFMLKP